MIKYSDNSKKFIKKLSKVHGDLEKAAANTLNHAAEYVENEYKKGIEQDYLLRDKRYTLGAIQTVKAHAIRKSGEIRPIPKINAVVGVRKQKGGKEHYLAKQEEGATVRGELEGKVPIPLDVARISGQREKKIKPGYRLNKVEPQTLTIGGIKGPVRKFGIFDTYSNKQRWGILYDIWRGRRGHKVGQYGWDLTKPFYFRGSGGPGIFAARRYKGTGHQRIERIRDLKKSSVRIRAHRTMEKATKKLTESKMDALFITEARKLVR